MAVVKVINGEYKNEDAIKNLVHYVLDKEKMPGQGFGATGVSLTTPVESFTLIQNAFGHNYGKRAEHIVLSFSEAEQSGMDRYDLMRAAYDICNSFEGRQCLFAFHEKDKNNPKLHVHFVLGTTNMITGKKENLDYQNQTIMKNNIAHILSSQGIAQKLILSNGKQ